MEQLVKDRIEANKHLFTEEELKVAEDNNTLIRKIYNIGLIDATNTMMR